MMKTILLLITLLLISCGDQGPQSVKSHASGVIIKGLNWQDIHLKANLKKSIKLNASAVADLMIPAIQSRCTGFLISEDIILTNHHCVADEKMAAKINANFAHEVNRSKLDSFTYKCDKFIGGNKELDYALIKCEGKPGQRVGVLKLKKEFSILSEDSLIYLIHHNCDYRKNPRCDWTKKLSPGKIQTTDFDTIRHSADSLRGSSGAPLISLKEGVVIGLHHAGKLTNARTQAGIYNEAIPMEKIVEDIKISFPEVSELL
jgi:V8-like Glu-specific endopeptidase